MVWICGMPCFNCPLGLLCGRRLKSDVRPWVRSFGYFAIFAFTNVTWDTETGCYCLLKKLKVLILEPSSLNFLQARLYRLFSTFFKNCKKVQEWYLTVKCGKAIKWIRFLCIKQRKIHIFADENSWSASDWRHRTSLFKLFHTRAPRSHPCPAGVI